MNPFPGTDLLALVIFGVCVASAVAGGLLAVFAARIIRSVCGLALCCIGLAGLYYFLHSPFLALMEILIYVGAVCVTIIFAVMLAEPEESRPGQGRTRDLLWALGAVLLATVVFVAVARLGVTGVWPAPPVSPGDASVKAIGVSLLTTYSLAFELISLVLLVAILGALVIARTGRTKP